MGPLEWILSKKLLMKQRSNAMNSHNLYLEDGSPPICYREKETFSLGRYLAILVWAILLLLMLIIFSQASYAQTFSVAAYFGQGTGDPALYCEGSSANQVLSDNTLYINTPVGNIAAEMASLQIVGIKRVKGVYSEAFASITALGYWYAEGVATGVPCQVAALFTELANGQGSVQVTITRYQTATIVYKSGPKALLGNSGEVIVPATATSWRLQRNNAAFAIGAAMARPARAAPHRLFKSLVRHSMTANQRTVFRKAKR